MAKVRKTVLGSCFHTQRKKEVEEEEAKDMRQERGEVEREMWMC